MLTLRPNQLDLMDVRLITSALPQIPESQKGHDQVAWATVRHVLKLWASGPLSPRRNTGVQLMTALKGLQQGEQ
jgi:hypothetical protein